MSLRVVFLGTPTFSVPCLKTLLSTGDVTLLGIITQPDRPAGRGNKLTPPPVKVVAEAAGLPVYQPRSLRKDAGLIAWLREQAPDFLATIAFGQILSQEVLDIPKHGTVNVHASLLPEYRGPNPIQRAVIEGRSETGLTTMLTDIGVDTGEMLLKTVTPIGSDESAADLHDRLSDLAGELLLKTLRGLRDGTVIPQPQPHDQATHAQKGIKEDAWLDWRLPAEALHNRIRGQQPWPGAATTLNDQRIKIIRARRVEDVPPATTPAESTQSTEPPGTLLDVDNTGLRIQTGDGVLLLVEVQPAGKAVMSARDWANGISRVTGPLRFTLPTPESAVSGGA